MYHYMGVAFTHYAVYIYSTCRHKSAKDKLLLNMRQSWVEIEHYFIAYFNHIRSAVM